MSAVDKGMIITPQDAVMLGATNLTTYGRLFFPKTFRQESPAFHDSIGKNLYDPTARKVAIEVFRDGAKTTLLRTFLSQRIAYGISRTVLVLSASQAHAILSVRWLKKQIEFNRFWTQTFQLQKGSKWTDESIEIINGTMEFPITIIALGITGQLRGFNIDDFRPDLIIADDISTDEMTATDEQRKKYENIFHGALINSLSPRSETPEAKAVLLDTPKSPFDLIESCAKDPEWRFLRYGVFDEKGESRWPSRYPTKDLQREKESYLRSGRTALWMREKECTLISDELMSFRAEHLRYWDVVPDGMTYIIAIDPASSESKTADDNVVGVLGFHNGNVYLMEYVAEIGQNPEMVSKTIFEYIRRYRISGIVVESVAYQAMLAWYLEREMREKRTFIPVFPEKDHRKKSDRIVQEMGGLTAYGKFYCRPTHTKFIQQFVEFSPLYKGHDDVIDMCAIGVKHAMQRNLGNLIEGEFEEVTEDNYPKLNFRAAP